MVKKHLGSEELSDGGVPLSQAAVPADQSGGKLTSSKFINRCFIFEQRSLEKIAQVLKQSTGSDVKTTIKLSDGSSLESTDLKSLLDDTLMETKSIRKIELRSYNFDKDAAIESGSVTIEENSFVGSVYYTASGKKNDVIALRETLQDLLNGSVRWFWPLNYRGNSALFLIELILAISIVLSFTTLSYKFIPMSWFGGVEIVKMVTIGIGGALLFNFLPQVREHLFPRLNFDFGLGKRIASRQDQFRKFIFVTIMLGTGLSVFNRQIGNIVLPVNTIDPRGAQPSENAAPPGGAAR